VAEHFRNIAQRMIGKPEGGISYRELEIQTPYTFAYIQKIVTGKKPLPKNADFYENMAKALHMKPEDIIEYNEIKAKELLEENPDLASALLDEEIRIVTSRLAEMTEEDRHAALEDFINLLKERGKIDRK